MKRYDDPYFRGYPMGPEWGRPHRDPNWRDGEYHGNRMGWSHHQGAYGFHRQTHEHDLQGYGGFDGIYDEGSGWYNREGQFEHPYFFGRMQHPNSRPQRYEAGVRYVEDGSVRRDTRYLRQYNAESPMLREGYERGFGWAPAAPLERDAAQQLGPAPRGRYDRGFASGRGPVDRDTGAR